MNNNLITKIKKYLLNHENKVKYRRILTCLAAIVVFCTIYALIMPAITTTKTLVCEQEEHVHNENCYTDNFICEDTEENRNDDSCYELIKTCTKEEHTHDDKCYQQPINNEISIMSLDDNISSTSIESRALTVYTSLKVYSVNYYPGAGIGYDNAVIAYSTTGQTVEKALGSSGMSFLYWNAIVVSYQNGSYVVTNIIGSGTAKNTLVIPLNGFILIVNDQESKNAIASVTTGSTVTANFTIPGQKYNTSGIGTLSFSKEIDSGTLKPSINNTDNLHIVLGADTKELIEVNLYDYGTGINSKYKENNKYPGFQQGGGTTTFSSFSEITFNFGDNITSEIDDIVNNVTHTCDSGDSSCTVDINATNTNANNSINRPISGVMNKYLIDDYPALKDGTSLKYLFSNNPSTTTTKKNTNNINGLFQYNSTTGAYSYNSRENHAEFNASNDTFTLYREMITSNFMMYPFGNFLPFNSIVTQATKAITVNREHFETISSSALYKFNQGYGSRYGGLSNMLTTFADLMDKEYGVGWDAADATSAYFKYAAGLADIDFPISKLENIYSIDFDEATNFFFGLEMKMNFMQPKDGKTGITGEEEMKFYFTGDDDVWVYVDDILFLDLSGIHRHVGGEIDFYNGVVNYYDLSVETGDVSETPTKTVKFADILGSTTGLNDKGTFENYSTHTFNFYYMERGAGSGVMRMNFNMPLLKKNSISVTKELSVDDGSSLGNPDFKFQILSANGDIKTEIPFIGKDVVYEIYNTNGIKVGTNTVGDNGIFTLKAGQTAVFSNISENSGKYYVRELLDENWASQYKQVSVDGTVTTSYNEITVGTENFSGIETGIKDASSGNTYFDFNNKVDTNKYGSLKLLKVINGEGLTSKTKNFKFSIKIDDVLLPIGTTYKVKNKTTGETTTRSVLESDGVGIITFNSYEEISIPNILVGSHYEVIEENQTDYIVSYQNNQGVITKTNEVATIVVTNTEKSTSFQIPIQKVIENPDGNKHAYKFNLVRVTDETGETNVSNTSQELVIQDIETSGSNEFNLTLLESDYNNGDKIYYKITEVNESNDLYKYDSAIYIIEVTITKTSTMFSPNITKIIKNNEVVSNIEFKNQILTNLSISKEIQKNIDTSKIFKFKITGTYQSEFINGTYEAILITKDGEVKKQVTFTDGISIIELKHSEKITIKGLLYGMTYQIEEMNTEGYVVKYQINPEVSDEIIINNVVSGTLLDTNHIKYINIGGYVLPETGSSLMLILIIIGVLLLIIPVIYIGYIFLNRKGKIWS